MCSHEHYIALNLPLLPSLDPPTSGAFENESTAYIESMSTLTKDYLQKHYLTGLVLSELARVLTGRYNVLPYMYHGSFKAEKFCSFHAFCMSAKLFYMTVQDGSVHIWI